MFSDTTASIMVKSNRMGCTYKIIKFMTYRFDIDIDTDTDTFNFMFANPDGVYTGIINKFDRVAISVNETEMMCGDVDTVTTECSKDGSFITVAGRDIAHILIDNDVIPGTSQSVEPVRYIRDRCNNYGLNFSSQFGSLPVTEKLEVGSGESEISICNNLANNLNHKLWFIHDTIYLGDLSYDIAPTSYFTRGVSADIQGIPIENITVTDDGTDTKSEVLIYGSMDDGNSKVLGTAKNQTMINLGITRRKVEWSSNNDKVTKYSSSALKKVKDSFRDNIVIKVKVKTSSTGVIYPNTTAHVIDTKAKINSILLIKGVTYEKGKDGSFTTIKMVPGDSTFNNLWDGLGTQKYGGITGIPTDTASSISFTRR